MSLKDIVNALKGYKAGTYGGAMKQVMVNQVKDLKDSDIEAMSLLMKIGHGTTTEKATEHAAAAAVAAAGGTYIDLNSDASDEVRIEQEDLGNRNTVSERALGLRKTNLGDEKDTTGVKADYDRPAPGQAPRFERAYKDAPPMIPHSVEGLLPITRENNQCLGCHLPEVAKSMGATPIPPTHFTDYRPTTVMKDGKVLKEGKVLGKDLGNTSDIKIAKAKKMKTLYEGRFNCSQCHAPQAKVKTDVANTFKPDYRGSVYKEHSSLADAMNEGVE
ncbi:MAG TPA: nitrate reductase cytochrome c-type subunit; periplasmic nitrate reductase electron transfer subunit [Epsilonproteobacteria bacterium]|nr:nitrate reductase cytochrome c-type subunit; periplasmic nitrate reductase electron transfer subunit [Campylobacterota bacterium]